MSDILIRGGSIVSVDPEIGDLVGDILVRDGEIAAVAASLGEPEPGTEVIDATDKIVIPGFVDTHRHTWQSSIRFRNTEHHGVKYFAEILDIIGPEYSPDDVYIGTLLGALTAIDAGTTTIYDWAQAQNSPAHSDGSVRGLRESGIRAVFGHGRNLSDPQNRAAQRSIPHSHDIRRIQEVLAGDPLVSLAMSARGPEAADDETWRADLDLARELGLMSSIHTGLCGLGPIHKAIERMHDAGALGPDLFFVHINTNSQREIEYLAEAGSGVSVGYLCEAISQGAGPIPTDRCLAAGIWPSMSGDTETISAGDMFSQMRTALVEYRLRATEERLAPGAPETLTAADALRMATLVGAQTIGLAETTGSITPGKAADLVLLDGGAVNLAPVGDPVGSAVLGAHPGNVDTVLIGGRVVKRDGRLVDVDLPRIIALARESHAKHPAQHV